MTDIPNDRSDRPVTGKEVEQGDVSSGLEDQLTAQAGNSDQISTRDTAEKPTVDEHRPSGTERLIDGAAKIIGVAKGLADILKEDTIDKASRAAGAVENVATNAHVPDPVARTLVKGTDAVKKGLLDLAGNDKVQRVFGFVKKFEGSIEKVGAVAEGVKHYQEAREGGLGKIGAGVEGVTAGVGDLVGKEGGKAFEIVIDGGARGLGIAVDTGIAAVRNDQTHLAKVSDSAASGKLGSLAFYSDVAGDALATGDPSKVVGRVTDAAASGKLGALAVYGDIAGDGLATHDPSKVVARITDAAADGKLGWLGRAGDWLGDHAWTATHRAR